MQPVLKTLGLVAHDEKKQTLVDWVQSRTSLLGGTAIYATGTTGARLRDSCPALNVTPLKSGPLGGDQQLGAMIAEGRLDALIFFIDPLTPQPHDVDVKALIRLATLANIPCACNAATADLLIPAPA
ncbi:methylglyoxal synthase [Yunchengibacter salinarum]|uniref:methylglyoxal synthase n=1 Tax=Yunchengibacter salinarum TaxID=3133399 RepID=UPI0035B611D0